MITRQDLYKSPVRFYEQEHEYWLGMNQLVGVTTILRGVLFAHKYDGISPEILAKAAAKGTAIHEAVQSFEMGERSEHIDKPLGEWIAWPTKDIYRTVDVEYLVSDEERVASKIDLVMTEGNDIILADIKTTKECDKEYLSWQLSFYAMLFEAQTGYKVSRLVGFWWTGRVWKEVQLERKSNKEVMSVIADYFNGVERVEQKAGLPAEVTSLADAIEAMERELKEKTAKRDELKEKMMAVMKDNGCEKVDIDGRVLITLIAPTTREAFDSKAFKADHPDMYGSYVKQSAVKESLKITIR